MDEKATGLLSCLGGRDKGPGPRLGALQKEISGYCKKLLAVCDKTKGTKGRETLFDLFSDGSGQRISVKVRLVHDRKSGPLFLLLFDPEEHILCMTRFLRGAGLTRREVEVVHLLAQGARNADIAKSLFISEYTVENHLKSVYRKMAVSNRTAVVHRLLQIKGDLD
jgi:DNA-binding CsgD family transcriptional regulator